MKFDRRVSKQASRADTEPLRDSDNSRGRSMSAVSNMQFAKDEIGQRRLQAFSVGCRTGKTAFHCRYHDLAPLRRRHVILGSLLIRDNRRSETSVNKPEWSPGSER